MNKVLDLSWSSYNAWHRAKTQDDVEDALRMMRGEPEVIPPSPAMELGVKWHKKWEEETLKTKQVPKIFGWKSKGPIKAEQKIVHQLSAHAHIRYTMILDGASESGRLIYDHKVSRQPMSAWLNTDQLILAAWLTGAKIGIINLYHPQLKSVKIGIRHITWTQKELVIVKLVKTAEDIIKYCQDNGKKYWRDKK